MFLWGFGLVQQDLDRTEELFRGEPFCLFETVNDELDLSYCLLIVVHFKVQPIMDHHEEELVEKEPCSPVEEEPNDDPCAFEILSSNDLFIPFLKQELYNFQEFPYFWTTQKLEVKIALILALEK